MISQGILLGLALSFMIGPLLFAIVEAGLERGFRAGLSVAVGIWLSDVLYVLAVWRGLSAMTALTALPNFKCWTGLLGGCLLIAFGLGSFFKKTEAPDAARFFLKKRCTQLGGLRTTGLPHQHNQSLHCIFLDRHRGRRGGAQRLGRRRHGPFFLARCSSRWHWPTR